MPEARWPAAVRMFSFLVAAGLCSASFAQDAPPPDEPLDAEAAAFKFVGFQLLHDNDGWISDPLDNDDQHYTAGSRIDIFLQGSTIDSIGDWLPWTDHFDNPEYAGGIGISQTIFTPRDIELEEPPRDERPYTGILLFHAYIQRFDDSTMDHIELDAGVVGPSSLAEEAQRSLHTARGWDKQLHDEFAFDATIRKTWKHGLFGTETGREGVDGWGVELLPQLGGTLGTVYRNAHAQLVFRAGYNIPGDFGPRRVFDISSAAPDPNARWGAYSFARIHGRGVQHNVSLDGNTFRDSRSVEKEDLVGEFEFGFAAALGKHLQLGWSWTTVSDEYKNDDSIDSYATLAVTAHFEF